MAMELLEYVSQDEQMHLLHDLPIFLCRDGNFRALNRTPIGGGIATFNDKLYIGTSQEAELFDRNGTLFLPLEKYPSPVAARVTANIQLMSYALNFAKFGLEDFKNYGNEVLFSNPAFPKKDTKMVEMSACGVQGRWFQKLWSWLDSNVVEDVSKVVQNLWLIPLEGQRLYQVISSEKFIR
jgi:hypothetical protein